MEVLTSHANESVPSSWWLNAPRTHSVQEKTADVAFQCVFLIAKPLTNCCSGRDITCRLISKHFHALSEHQDRHERKSFRENAFIVAPMAKVLSGK